MNNWNTMWDSLQGSMGVHIPQVLGALAIFIIGWLAAALVTVDPILLNQSAQVMTETLATFLDGIASSTSHGQAVVVQSSLLDTFAGAIRRDVRDLGLDRPTAPSPAMSIG